MTAVLPTPAESSQTPEGTTVPRRGFRRPRASAPRRARNRREAGLAYLLLVPAAVIFGVFVFYPFAYNFKLALYESPPFPGLPSRYVGLHQVGQVLTSSGFVQSLVSTLFFVVLTVPAAVLLGLVLAIAAHRKLRGIGIYRTIFSSTVVSSVAVAALVFGTLLDPVNGLLPWLGINPHPPLLENPTWALPSVAALTVWQGLGLSFIVMSAGLQSVPDEVLEAATVDGATAWTRFWRVTVPLLSPTIFFVSVVATITAFQTFGQIDLLIGTQAAYLHANVLPYNIYQTLLIERNPGAAAVLSLVLFFITLAVTLLQLRILERRVTYAR
jgi:sn-glycerol 3-phosphate transport system permease protein